MRLILLASALTASSALPDTVKEIIARGMTDQWLVKTLAAAAPFGKHHLRSRREAECIDKAKNCNGLESFCSQARSKKIMEAQCAKSCGFCTPDTPTGTTPVISRMTPPTMAPSSSCEDQPGHDCTKFLNYCDNFNTKVPEMCKKSCNLCDSGNESAATTKAAIVTTEAAVATTAASTEEEELLYPSKSDGTAFIAGQVKWCILSSLNAEVCADQLVYNLEHYFGGYWGCMVTKSGNAVGSSYYYHSDDVNKYYAWCYPNSSTSVKRSDLIYLCRNAEHACAGESSVQTCMRDLLKKTPIFCPDKYTLLVAPSDQNTAFDHRTTNYGHTVKGGDYECSVACHSEPTGWDN